MRVGFVTLGSFVSSAGHICLKDLRGRIYSLDHIARNSQFLATWNEEHNSIQNALEKFISEYVAILLDELLYDLNSEQKNLIYKMIPLVEKI